MNLFMNDYYCYLWPIQSFNNTICLSFPFIAHFLTLTYITISAQEGIYNFFPKLCFRYQMTQGYILTTESPTRYNSRTYLVWRGALCSQTPARHWTVSWWQWCMDSEAYTWLCSLLPHGLSLSQSQFYHLQTQIRQILKMLCMVYKLDLWAILMYMYMYLN